MSEEVEFIGSLKFSVAEGSEILTKVVETRENEACFCFYDQGKKIAEIPSHKAIGKNFLRKLEFLYENKKLEGFERLHNENPGSFKNSCEFLK